MNDARKLEGVALVKPESGQGDQFAKRFFIGANAILWLSLWARLVRRWHVMSGESHFSVIFLAVIFPVLLVYLIREKNSFLCLLVATIAFGDALDAAFP